MHKLDYDRQVKNSFLRELDKKLYESHSSFASNPLLLTMMLLTYEQIAEIPNKIHLFYEQAFLTLFNKHDSLKSMYKRKSFSQLPLDDFKRCLEAFCILSYSGRSYSFSENEINKYLDNSINISRVTTNSKFFLNDLLDSVCILQRDGLGFNFTHRSFQEYFSAQFLVNIISAN
ncbi:NACHT domain-containing protein, partial [Acinetobacter baumannii]